MNSFRHDDNLNYYSDNSDYSDTKITLLSRQLKTYLNYKESTIIAICSDYDNYIAFESPLIQRLESELRMLYFEYKKFLQENFESNDNYKIKFLILAKKALLYPSSPETRAFNSFLKNKIRMWNLIHGLSGLEIHKRPQLFKRLITIIIKFCDEESKINECVANFFHQLKLNYLQLEREYGQLVLVKNNEQNKAKKINKKRRVMIRE